MDAIIEATLVSFLLAIVATEATVELALWRGRRIPEVGARCIILLGWWAVFYLVWLAVW